MKNTLKSAMQIQHLINLLWNLIEWSWRNHGNLLFFSFYPASSLFTLCLCCQRVSWLWNSGSDLNSWNKWGMLWGNSWMRSNSTWRCEGKLLKNLQLGRVPGKLTAYSHLLLPLARSLTEFWSEVIWQRNWRVLILSLFLTSLKINQQFLQITY